MQKMLNEGRSMLLEAGIVALGPSQLRPLPGFAEFVKNGSPVDLHRELEKRAGSARQLLLSEENLIGTMKRNLQRRLLYDNAYMRLSAYREAFGPVTRIGLGIRSYESYWLSTLRFVLAFGNKASRSVPPFVERRAGMARVKRGWCDLVADMRAVFPEAELLVWPVEARLPLPEILRHLTGREDLDLPSPPRNINTAPEVGYIPVLEANRAETSAFTNKQMREWLKTQTPEPFEGFTQGMSAAMAMRYADDLAALANGYKGAILLAGELEL